LDILADPSKDLIPMPLEEESYLAVKALRFSKAMRGLRKPTMVKIFEPVTYIAPTDVAIENYWRTPIALFNPGAIVENKRMMIFPRTIFDYYWYVSSVGYIDLDIDRILSGSYNKPIRMKIIMYPRYYWELGKGTEDPRVAKCEEKLRILYTAVAFTLKGIHPLQGFAELRRDFSEISRKFLRIKIEDKHYVPISWKDSALLDPCITRGYILTRPTLRFGDNYVEINWRGYANFEESSIDFETLEPVLVPEEWEIKTGWSTNTIQISSNEYLVGWHSVLKNGIYVNGIALVSKEGELLALSDYLLVPQRIEELYGDRPGVIFGCGLIRYKEKLIWIGGVADVAIGIYVTDLDKVFEILKPVKKS